MIKKQFGENLKSLRTKKKKGLSELSRQSGLASSFLKDLEGGNKQPTLTTIFVLAAALECHPSLLIESTWREWIDAGQPDQ